MVAPSTPLGICCILVLEFIFIRFRAYTQIRICPKTPQSRHDSGAFQLCVSGKRIFFEEFLWLKVLQPLLHDLKPKRMAKSDLQESTTYDFDLEATDLAIEVVSTKKLDKIERKKGIARADGKRLLILTTEELIVNINAPEKIAETIKTAVASTDAYVLTDKKADFEFLFVSYDLTKKYSDGCFTELHVDVNIVENDVLNLEKACAQKQFEKANFKLNTEGVFTCHWEVEKMSKSKFNVVNPDDVVAQYGADCFRMYEMFLGPIEDAKPWSTTGITGVQGFLRKLWSLFFDLNTGKNLLQNDEPTAEELKALHKCIKKVNDDIERFSLNTCVSSFMVCVNELKDLKCHKPLILKELVTLVAPFAPFIAEELNAVLGNTTSVLANTFPIFNEAYLKESSILYPISINGKKRAEATFSADMKPTDIEAEVRAMEIVKKWTEGEGKDIKKVIIVPGRMVNIVS
ncbi:MAG: class I tRNA ligase family protein [Saprospiraceae bacterium]|nr:class I tRNA ligase family protein [Saprospiraceae bacterium]